jgi:EmrB/QacA subfamily drug resistance transporter
MDAAVESPDGWVLERSARLTLLACILGSGIAFLDGSLVNVALPAIARDLGGGLAGQQWIVDGYLLTLGSLVLVGGSLGDLLGRRRVFAAGVSGFGAASLLCACSPSVEVLIGFRLLQGAAGALLVPNSLALIADTFAEHQRATAIGSWTSWTGIATIAGPLIGGAIVDSASWRWIFVVNIPAVAATLWLLQRAPAGTRIDVRIDWQGATLCALGLGLATLALIEQPSQGWGGPAVLPPLLGGIALLCAFVVRERTAVAPMMPLGLFRSRNFAVSNAATLALYGAIPAATFFLVLFLQQVRGVSALQAGASLLPTTVVIFLLAKRFGALADRTGPRLLMGVGPLVAAAGLTWLLALGKHGSYLAVVLPATTVLGLGLSMSVAPLTSTVMGSVDPDHDGVASGVNNAVARVGGLAAIAGIGAVVAARFSHSVRASLGPGAEVSAAARHPLSVDTAAFAPGQRVHAHIVLGHASVQALHVAITISIGLALMAGIAALVWIRDPAIATQMTVTPGGFPCVPPACSSPSPRQVPSRR